jgi:hypothetical protein
MRTALYSELRELAWLASVIAGLSVCGVVVAMALAGLMA